MGQYLAQPITTKESSSGSCETHSWGASCMQGWRIGMEDAHITISDLGDDLSGVALFGVFDGHGGQEVAMYVSETLPDEVRRQLRDVRWPEIQASPADEAEAFGTALTKAFIHVDALLREPEAQRRLQELRPKKGTEDQKSRLVSIMQGSIQQDVNQAAQRGSISVAHAQKVLTKTRLLQRIEASSSSASDPTGDAEDDPRNAADGVGCTAVAVLISKRQVVCANAGDSRGVLVRKCKAVPLSYDHKPNDAVERRRIEAAGGTISCTTTAQNKTVYRIEGNLNLSRCIGDHTYKSINLPPEKQMICCVPDIKAVPLTPEDQYIVLACDGIWDCRTNEDIAKLVSARRFGDKPLPQAIEALLDACLAQDPKKTGGIGGDNMTCIIVRLKHEDRDSGEASPSGGRGIGKLFMCGLCSKS